VGATVVGLFVTVGFLAAVVAPWREAYRRASVGTERRARALRYVESELRQLLQWHSRLYVWIAGEHPHRRIWHSQWLSVKDLYSDFRRILPTLRGRLLDVGCRGKPYAPWLTNVNVHVGVDVMPGDSVDLVIRDGESWPLPSATFQSLLCSQVLQVVHNVPHLVNEVHRVLEPGGIAVLAVPFCYSDMSDEHDRDFWRHSFHGIRDVFGDRFEVVEARRQGGFGSSAGFMILSWVRISMDQKLETRLLMALLLPVWIPVCLAVNVLGWLFDKVDRTGVFYHNVLLVLRKKA
jgi:SAM-dependent methyltransferase